jgi:hypothetical protein
MREVAWGIIVLPGLEVGAPVSLSHEAKAEAPAVITYMGYACPVYEMARGYCRLEAAADIPAKPAGSFEPISYRASCSRRSASRFAWASASRRFMYRNSR